MSPSINAPPNNVSLNNVSAINIPAITGKIYGMIVSLIEVLEELNTGQGPLSAQMCGLEGMDSKHEPMDATPEPMDAGRESMVSKHEPNVSEHRPIKPIDPPDKRAESRLSNLFHYLTGNEGLELVRLESTSQSLRRAQGFLEERKQALLRLARSRQGEK